MLSSDREQESIKKDQVACLHDTKHQLSRDNAAKEKTPDDPDRVKIQRYETLIENIPCAVYTASPGKMGPTTFISGRWKDWTGYSPEQFYQDPRAWPKCIHPDDREEVQNAYIRACRDHAPYNLEYRVIHKDTGQVRYVSDQGLLNEDEKGAVVRVDGIVTDITKLREAENELEKYRDHLEELVEERTRALASAHQVLKLEDTERRRMENLVGIERDSAVELGSTTGLQEELRICLEAAMKASGMDCGGIYLIDEASGGLELAFHQGLSPEFVASVSHHDEDSPNVQLVRKGKTVYTEYEKLGVPLDSYERREGLKAIAVVPMIDKGQVVGCMNVASHSLEVFPARSRAALETVTAEIGGMIRQLKAEEELRESEAKFRGLAETSTGAILIHRGARLLYVNPAAEKITGYSAEELLRTNFGDLVHPDFQEMVKERGLARQRGEQPPSRYEFKFITKSGQERWMEIAPTSIMFEGRPALMAAGFDITERKWAEEGLREAHEELENRVRRRTAELERANRSLQTEISERKQAQEQLAIFRKFAEASEQALGMAKLDGSITYANPTLCRVLGARRPQDICGTNVAEYYSKEDLPRLQNEILPAVIQTGHHAVEIPVLSADGKVADVIQSIFLIRDDQGQPFRLANVITDITERKQAEEELKKHRDHLEEMVAARTDELRRSNEELEGEITERKQAEQEIKRKSQDLTLINSLNSSVNEGGSLDALIPQFSKETMELFPPYGAAVYLLSKDKTSLLLKSYNLPPKIAKAIEKLIGRKMPAVQIALDEDSVHGQILRAGRTRVTNDAATIRRMIAECTRSKVLRKLIPQIHRMLGIRTVVAIPLLSGNETFGLMEVSAGSPAELDVRRLETMAGQLTAIIRRTWAEGALRESEERLKILFESAPDAIYVTDLEGRFVNGNRAAEELVGFAKADYIGKNLTETGLLSAEQMPRAVANLEKTAASEPTGPNEYTLRRKDGSHVAVEVRTFPIRIRDKALSLGIARDITERKRAEQTLIEYQAQLKSLASQLSLTEERERHRLATKLHDQISQSLVISKIKLDRLRQSASSRELKETLEDVGDCLVQTIEDTRTLTFEMSSPILHELGFETAVANWLANQIQKEHGIVTEFEDDGQFKPLDNDIRALLFRNVRELLVNVVKHAQARKVTVSIDRIDKHIRVCVEDDGVGFDPVEVTTITAKRVKFGLFSIRERLEQLGGRIEIDSEPGRGSRITMTAPLKYREAADQAEE